MFWSFLALEQQQYSCATANIYMPLPTFGFETESRLWHVNIVVGETVKYKNYKKYDKSANVVKSTLGFTHFVLQFERTRTETVKLF